MSHRCPECKELCDCNIGSPPPDMDLVDWMWDSCQHDCGNDWQERHYDDGTVEIRHPDGGIETIYPDERIR